MDSVATEIHTSPVESCLSTPLKEPLLVAFHFDVEATKQFVLAWAARTITHSSFVTPPALLPRGRHRELWVDAQDKGNEARFISHSCEPNCRAETFIRYSRDHVPSLHQYIFAQMDIEAGAEITIDYHWDAKAMVCLCESRNCRNPPRAQDA